MSRFMRRGKTKFRWATSIANKATVTRAEITASIALTLQIAEVAGFHLTNSPISVPDLDTKFTKTMVGEDTTDQSTLTFYDEDVAPASNLIRTALAKDTAGFILIFPYGDTVGRRMECWPVRSTGPGDEISAGNDAARYTVSFAVTDEPSTTGVVPA